MLPKKAPSLMAFQWRFWEGRLLAGVAIDAPLCWTPKKTMLHEIGWAKIIAGQCVTPCLDVPAALDRVNPDVASA